MRKLTIYDLELFYRGQIGHPFIDLADMVEIEKAVGDIHTGRGLGYFNAIYGAQVWVQLNLEANAFGMLPKVTWPRSGWRVQTAFATGSASEIGIGETGLIPTPVYPTVVALKALPKVQALSFEVSDVLEALARAGADDIFGTADQIRANMGAEFMKRINQQLLTNVDTSAGNMLESIDRIVSGYPEASKVTPATDVNIYGIERHTAPSWADAYVNLNTGTGNRDLTDELIRTTLMNVRANGGNPTVILTGYDTYAKLQGLYMNFIRYLPMSETQVTFGLNGIQTAQGSDVGLRVAALYGIPLISAVDCPKDGISRIYVLDTSDPEGFGLPRFAISVLRPVEYFEARDFVLLNKFVIKGVYRFVGETICRFFKAQGKIRDLQ